MQILALEFKTYVLFTPWLFFVGVPNSETAIPDFLEGLDVIADH